MIKSDGEEAEINDFQIVEKPNNDIIKNEENSLVDLELIVSDEPNMKDDEPELIVSDDESLPILNGNDLNKPADAKDYKRQDGLSLSNSTENINFLKPNYRAPVRRKVQHINILSSDSE